MSRFYVNKEDCKYTLVPWHKWLEAHPYTKAEDKHLPPVGTCAVCRAGCTGYVATLTDGFNTWGATDICSEECYNLWLLQK